MSATIVDALAVLNLARRWRQKYDRLTDLYETMRADGRDTLTPEELAEFQAADDAARQSLVDAINQAEG